MNKTDLEIRTKRFALNIIQFVATLPRNKVGDVITHQLVKSGTSVGANYREATRAESRNDFIHKIAIVEKEASETQYWLELCDEATLGNPEARSILVREAGELVAIFTQSAKTAKTNRAATAGR